VRRTVTAIFDSVSVCQFVRIFVTLELDVYVQSRHRCAYGWKIVFDANTGTVSIFILGKRVKNPLKFFEERHNKYFQISLS